MTLKTHARSIRKCPFWRTIIKSKALNISLQDLIRTSKEQEIQKESKPLTIKEAQREKETPEYYEPVNNRETEDLRKSILVQEKNEIEILSRNIHCKIESKGETLDKLKLEEREWMDRLEKAKKELSLIRDFIDKQEKYIEKLRNEKKRADKKVILVDDILNS